MSTQPAPSQGANTNEQPAAIATLPEPGKASVQLQVGAKGFNLNTLDEAWRFCAAMVASGLMPKGMDTAQKVLFALQKGFEVGLPPLMAIQSIAVINGRASLYGDAVLGIVMNSGKFDFETFEEDFIRDNGEVIGAYCVVRRLPNGKPKRWDFTKQDAMTGKLWGKEGPWTTNPKRMLQMRARAFALRDIFPDVLTGIITVEEARDIPLEPEKNVTPAKPTTLDDLTERLTSDGTSNMTAQGAAQAAATDEVPTTATAETSVEAAEAAAVQEEASGPMAAIRAQLLECKTVPDVTRYKNTLTGPASKLDDEQKALINAECDARAQAIRSMRKPTGSQLGLV